MRFFFKLYFFFLIQEDPSISSKMMSDWLPLIERVEFKILLLTFKCLNGTAPPYLKELLKPHSTQRTLRSNQGCLTLSLPKIRTVRYGKRAFGNVAPYLWNSLPSHIKTETSLIRFKKMLKTHLFEKAYP